MPKKPTPDAAQTRASTKPPPEAVSLPTLECQACGHRWVPRQAELPKRCPNKDCQSTTWSRAVRPKRGRPSRSDKRGGGS